LPASVTEFVDAHLLGHVTNRRMHEKEPTKRVRLSLCDRVTAGLCIFGAMWRRLFAGSSIELSHRGCRACSFHVCAGIEGWLGRAAKAMVHNCMFSPRARRLHGKDKKKYSSPTIFCILAAHLTTVSTPHCLAIINIHRAIMASMRYSYAD
jgi:hypothetical protein